MPDYDASFKIVARAAGPRLPLMGGVVCDKYVPIGGEVQAIERLADRAFRAQAGSEPFVIYMEAYTRWDDSAPWSVLAKSGLLSARERLPTVALVYVLLPKGYRSQKGRIHLRIRDKTRQLVRFEEICLWKKKPQPWWEESPAIMALYPFCQHGRSGRDAVMHAADVIRSGESDALTRADLLTALGLFGRLVYKGMDVMGLIGREQMKESPLYREIMDEGTIERGRADVQEALEVRFGDRAAAFTIALRGINDAVTLSRLHRLAISCRRVTEFRKALEAELPRR